MRVSSLPVSVVKSERPGSFDRNRLVLLVGTALVSSLMLFTNLGHYALWDDEALTALIAEGILRTGDTSAVLDHNIVAYREGMLLIDLKDRSTPPLSEYITAASFALFGANTVSARAPFALAGLMTVVLLLSWAGRAFQSLSLLAVFCMGLVGNVSFHLYCRQCRYYALAMLFTVVLAWLYLNWKGAERPLIAFGFAFGALFAAHYTTAIAVAVCVCVDYVLWRRHECPIKLRGMLCVIGPALVVSLPIAAVWNPLRTAYGQYAAANTLSQKFLLWLWQWRDMSQCEMLGGGVLLLAVIFVLKGRDPWLTRGLAALTTFVTVMTATSPQLMAQTSVADVRYLTAAIPLCVALVAGTLWKAVGQRAILALLLAALTFGTNLLNGGPILWCGTRSTLLAYAGEMIQPIDEPYTPAAKWLSANVPDRASVWVLPDYCTYPLMFHAPAQRYAWQLSGPAGQFAGLDAINFKGRVPPEFLVVFGPFRGEIVALLRAWRAEGIDYRPVKELPHFWKDLYRPELFWRSFVSIMPVGDRYDAVYVLQLRHPAAK
jgi:4-amino-4-deoxy-L-arabinose transferase-like glycosyltransferase